MFLILGTIPYIGMAALMGSMGYNYSNWQFWVMAMIMFFSDAISYIKGAQD